MQITGNSGVNSASTIGNLSLDQSKDTDKTAFAQQLASETEKAQAAKDDIKLKKTCQDMEAVFLNMMMTDMRKTVQKSKLFDDSQAHDVMTSMLDTEMTKDMAKAGGMGLADMMYRQLRVVDKGTKNTQALK